MKQLTSRRFMLPGMAIILVGLTLLQSVRADSRLPEAGRPFFDMPLENTVDAGYLKLSWEPGYGVTDGRGLHFEVQRASSRDFDATRTIYRGPDRATFRSGLRNGNYYYRVRSLQPESGEFSAWSEVLTVRVAHHSLPLALWLFALGALVFLLTVAVIVHGTWKTAREAA